MGEEAVQYYLNPLTLEALQFLDSMEMYGKSNNQIDSHLCKTLENVVMAIEKFLGQDLNAVVQTENTKLIFPKDLTTIQRIFHCTACKLDLGKTADKVAVHLVDGHKIKSRSEVRKDKHKAAQERRANIVVKLPKKNIALISNDMTKFFADNILVAEKLKQIPEYDVIESELLKLITDVFPKQSIKLYKFGSRISGVGTQNSDLDLFIDIGKTFNTFENRPTTETQKKLSIVRDVLRKKAKAWPNLLAIEKARVPIIRVCNAATGIECDIGFSNSLGYCNTKLMAYMFELQPIARRMSIFLKKWLERSKLNDYISSYSISLMVIYFLQLNKHLPAVELLQFGLETVVNVGPWIANFTEKKLKDLNIQQIDITAAICQKFLKNFFELYSDFNFQLFAVCPFYGRRTEISQIESEMPERYSKYVAAGDASKDRCLQINKCMVIQDPIQLNHNVTKAVTPIILKQAVEYFRQSAVVLSQLGI